MSQTLIIALIAVDLVLVGLVVLALRRRKEAPENLQVLREIHHEHRLLKELRDAVREDMAQKHSEMRSLYEKVAKVATETDIELKSGADTLAQDMEHVLQDAKSRLDVYIGKVDKRRTQVSALLKKVQEERILLQKALSRGEKLTKFFDTTVPYEDVLEELEDKKYVDARHLLARGITPAQIAKELGLAESEVQLIASLK